MKSILEEVIDNPDIKVVQRAEATESEMSAFRDEVRSALSKALAKRYGTAIPMIPTMSSGGTDGMHYRALGYDTMAIGAGASRPQDIYAHGLNERMRVDQFYAGLDHWSVILKELAGD